MNEPCKGDGCDDPIYFRFVKVGSELVFLRRNSNDAYLDGWPLMPGAFAALGLTLTSDSQFAVRAFLPADTMSYASNSFQLVSRACSDTSLRVVFHHPILGDVRFDGQLFLVNRPDGSCLTFEYVPYFSEKEIVWDRPPDRPSRSGYSWKKVATYGAPEVRYDPFVTPDVVELERDARVVGRTQRGDPVYELKDPKHILLRELYQDYEATVARAAERAGQEGSGVRPAKQSYEQFLATRPIFLWRDPFGRLLRFTNNDFLPVYEAEPVVYLYPTAPRRVHVEAQPLLAISASTPLYHDGWDVLAQPTGELTGIADRRTYRYLFWEGLSSTLPMRQEGFVLRQAEVADFLERILPSLGLNARESQNFRDAWLPRFHVAPYYFITFLPREAIDQLAPLTVTPRPDVVIRVLMDFRPLWTSSDVKAPDLPPHLERRGFTVVEWGGILR
jgi:hypothetical protein